MTKCVSVSTVSRFRETSPDWFAPFLDKVPGHWKVFGWMSSKWIGLGFSIEPPYRKEFEPYTREDLRAFEQPGIA